MLASGMERCEVTVHPVKTGGGLVQVPHTNDDNIADCSVLEQETRPFVSTRYADPPGGAWSKPVACTGQDGFTEKLIASTAKESDSYNGETPPTLPVKDEAVASRSSPLRVACDGPTRPSVLNQLLCAKPVLCARPAQAKGSSVMYMDLQAHVPASRSEKRSRKTRKPTKRAPPVDATLENGRFELSRTDINSLDGLSLEPGDDSVPRLSPSLGLCEEQRNMGWAREHANPQDTVKSRLLAPAKNSYVMDKPRVSAADCSGQESSIVSQSAFYVSEVSEQGAVDLSIKGSNSSHSSDCVKKTHVVSINEDQFSCDICQKSFPSLACLNSHTITHLGKVSNTFGICREDFPQQSRRKCRSLALIVDSPSYSHNTDQESFAEQFQLKSQGPTRMQTDQKACICSVCGKCFRLPSLLKKHKRTHTGEKPHSCTTCGKAFAQRAHLKIHARSHTGEKPYVCNLCDKAFTLQCSLKRHSLTHTGIKAFTCSICQKSYYCRPDLNKHLRTHKGVKIFPRERPDIHDKPFVCGTCGKRFPRQSELKRHNMTHTGEKPHTCEVCGKCFSVQYKLKIHNLIHTGERPHVCPVCGKAFTQLSGLSLHRITHTGERPYTCDTCGKSFTHPSALSTHKRIHTGEKPYTCTTCGKSFGKSCSLRIHTLIHTGEKPFVCDICGKSFIQSFALKTHKVTHTGKMPYNCSICGKGFTGHSAWKRHGLTHTGEKPFTCDICGQNFTRQFSLKTHYKKCQMSKGNTLISSSS